MIKIVLYPTETVYGLGVDALDDTALEQLYKLKDRKEDKAVSWLVRDLADIEHYAELDPLSRKLVELFLPGPLTLVLRLRNEFQDKLQKDRTIGFRISSDIIAQRVIVDFMNKYQSPLTCTSANVSGLQTKENVPEILNQLGDNKTIINSIYDDGDRSSEPSTVIQVIDGQIECLREGQYSCQMIKVYAETNS